jgi:uncharacterized membrane protein
MADYTYGQLEELWIQAGGSKALAPLMAAIALAESAGNPAANNYDDNGGTQTSWGLWQISDGTHNQPVQNIDTPLINARAAVAKYNAQGLGAWGTYTSGAYQQFYKGDVAPGQLPQGGGATAPQQAADVAWWNPLDWPGTVSSAIGSMWKDTTGAAGAVADTGSSLNTIARGFTLLLNTFEWFFIPSHWVRVAAGVFGVMFLIPGVYALMKAAQGGSGDMTLGVAILLVTIAGVLLFIAFHNLPDDVRNLQQLLSWMSASIRAGKPAGVPGVSGFGAVAGNAV